VPGGWASRQWGVTSAAYGVSKTLFAAEFVALPPEKVLKRLASVTRRFVLEGAGMGQRFFRVRESLLAGSPRAGGWGSLPWREHVTARHAMWVARLLHPQAQSRPWATLAYRLLHRFDGSPEGLAALPPPLRRLVRAVGALPPPTPVATQLPHDAGRARAMAAVPLSLLSVQSGRLSRLRVIGVRTVGDLLHKRHALQVAAAGRQRLPEAIRRVLAPAGPDSDAATAAFLQSVIGQLPTGWEALELGAPRPPAAQPSWLTALASAVHWEVAAGKFCTLSQLTVKRATLLQMGPRVCGRDLIFRQFAAMCGPNFVEKDVADFFSRVWRLPWDNHHKEVLWGLAYDAFPTPERLAGGRDYACGCGASVPGRQHYFWDCSIAQPLIQEVQRHLPPATAPLRQAHIWLGCPPLGQDARMWAVVALAALGGLNSARKFMTKDRLGQQSRDEVCYSRFAVGRFWALLADFCALDNAPESWRDLDSPFIRWTDGVWQTCRAPADRSQ